MMSEQQSFNRTMTPPRLNLLVLRSPDPSGLADFYSRLGLAFERHWHGNGPEHFGAESGGTVLEIYPLDSTGGATAAVRLGFAVADVDKSCSDLLAAGGTAVRSPCASQWGRRAVVQDLDGHKVELTEALEACCETDPSAGADGSARALQGVKPAAQVPRVSGDARPANAQIGN